ncbi:TlpA family protein disulfide reductase [Massilia oculi]|uniref:TlpA family protein disulfide reductase n=1 Tax=Massilia hydrophila TaxID=3044279 RepID=A0ABS7YB09_9BURK|nr:TlpA disulfide reductase family protein [Massilia oculi]MCA1855709.1 TlpA family protein disulfide reductase [Massilia oculi]
MTASTDSPRSRPWIKPAAACALVLALAGIGYTAFDSGTPAPNVTFISIAGDKISTESLRGKVVMVNFWATSCTTCVKEMPQMVETYNKYKAQGLEFVAVAMQYDPPNYVLNFTETRKLPFTVAIDSAGDIARQFGDVTLTPTTFLIDKDGRIIKKYVGEPDFAALHKLLEKELAS